MSAYTGRYVSSHQVAWNAVPLPLEELTIGDYLRPHGIRTALVGKTHATPNLDALQRLNIDPDSTQAQPLNEVGFEAYVRHDGLYPDSPLFDDKRESAPYTHYLREQGYTGTNPWHEWANAAEGENGEVLSGWHMRNAGLPARVAEEHSETVYTTESPSTLSGSRPGSRGACTCPISNRTGLTSPRRRITRYMAWSISRPRFNLGKPAIIRFTRHFANIRRASTSPATKCG
jgi:arylsulfatase A-like enzyme